MPKWFSFILSLFGLRPDPDFIPDGARVVYDEGGVVHYADDGRLVERSLSDGYEEIIYERGDTPVWEPDESGWSEADSDAYYLLNHDTIPPSMLVDEEDERWVL